MARYGAGEKAIDWYEILEVCRTLGKNGASFTAADLDKKCSFPENKDMKSTQVASGWLSKFATWGYIERSGTLSRQGLAGRPAMTYKMTKDGLACSVQPGKLTRLLRFIRLLQSKRGTPDEGRIYRSLFDLADRIERNLPYDERLEREADPRTDQ